MNKNIKIHFANVKFHIKELQEKKESIDKETAKVYTKEIDKEINALAENTYKEKIKIQSQEERKNKFKDYDIFYDVYTEF